MGGPGAGVEERSRGSSAPAGGNDAPSGKRAVPILGRLILGVVVVNLFVGVLVGFSAHQSLQRYQETAAGTSRNLAKTTEQYVADLIDKIDYLLFDTVAEIERELRLGGLDTARTNRFIVQRQNLLTTLEAIRVADDNGQVIFGSAPSSTVPRNLSDRDYFIHQRDNAEGGLFISRSHVSRVTGRWSIFFSRRINRPDGSFFGVAYSVIPADTIEEYFSRIDVGSHGGISLRDDKLTGLVRHPDPKGEFRGNTTLTLELQRFLDEGRTEATFYSEQALDGVAQTASIRKIGRFPLFINIGLAKDDYLAPWRAELCWSIALYGVFVLATLTWAFLLYRAWQQRMLADERARHTLEERVIEKTAHLRDYATALERSNADLEQFAYVASHDLREPLRMVSSYLDLLERRYGSMFDQDGHEFIAFAKEGAVRMDRLVQDLLEFSRIGRHANPPKPTPLGPLVENVLRVLGRSIDECQGQVIVPDVLPEIICCGDELFLLFQNLISNALKFRTPDRPPEIRLGVERLDNAWQFSVADNGIGIQPDYFDRIFLIFQRLHTRKQYEGTGIGLAVCKKIVERHGGRIWVQSTPGQGSTFLFTLPDDGSAPSLAAEMRAES
ncbi:MAG TPA: ATP-binding protein [Magnetospirillum sp.]|nr:ATP-binding protein [Magnetospirillum sp.]